MNAFDVKKKFLSFFKDKGHAVIKSASLIPEGHDPTVLFTTAGMHPLVPYLLGQPHPLGKRLANSQKCIRTGDIDEVGDASHLTFFEMLGNWSLGDYFKKESITWSYEFLTQVLKIDSTRIHVTVFEGDKDAPKDEEAAKIWENLGMPKNHIYYLNKKENWWDSPGETGPCGPDSEIFIDTGKEKCSPKCNPSCDCGKYIEVWNNVFMQYNKTKGGKYEKLKQKNVDTGMGLERITAMLQGKKTVYETELFKPLINELKKLAEKYDEKSARIIVDHVRAATFILGDEKGITPSNLDQGYVLRRLIRRAIRHGRLLGINEGLCQPLAKIVINIYALEYPELKINQDFIINELYNEEKKFRETLEKGLTKFKTISRNKEEITGGEAFLLFQSYGFPIEMIKELADEKRIKVDAQGFNKEYKKHQELSRIGAEKRFKGGLADSSEQTIKLHTATHLLNEALRRVLGDKVKQKGSNITPERLRFDFSYERKLTPEELKKVEALVNKMIQESVDVKREEMSVTEAKELGAQAEFEEKYADKVSVYSIGDFSIEICGGPHVKNTKELGRFKIRKEEAVASGVRRIKAVIE